MKLGTIGIVGLGLLGATIGMTVRRRALATRVVGVDVDANALAIARQRGAIDEGAQTLELVADADVVVVAVPPAAVVEVALQAATRMKPRSVLTDVASTKAAIAERLERSLPPHVAYVGGHPMAGSERQGAASADPALLAGRPFVLTSTARSTAEAVALLKDLVLGLGMRPIMLTPAEHDALVAQVSHLPYLVAVAVMNAASEAAVSIRGPAFEELVRLASSPVGMWVQICQANREAIGRALATFRRELEQLERLLGEPEALETVLERTKQRSQALRS